MSNPILNNNFVENEQVINGIPMTVNGTLGKTFILFTILMASAVLVWHTFILGQLDKAQMLTSGGAIIGFVLALVIAFTKNKYLIPVYAACEGAFLGGVSAIFEAQYSGIVFNAISATFMVMLSMLFLYRANIIKCTDKFRSILFTATLAIALLYILQIIGSFFGYTIPGIFNSGTVGLAFSVVVTLIAAFNLIVDFDFIEKGAQNFLPKDFEWYGAFGLMVTLVWLYLEILRLLAKLNNRN